MTFLKPVFKVDYFRQPKASPMPSVIHDDQKSNLIYSNISSSGLGVPVLGSECDKPARVFVAGRHDRDQNDAEDVCGA